MINCSTPANCHGHTLLLIQNEDEFAWTADALAEAEIQYHRCENIPELAEMARQTFGAALIAIDTVNESDLQPLLDFLDNQKPWEDLPLIWIVDEASPGGSPPFQVIKKTSSLTVLQRKLSPVTLVSSLRTALRARQCQYRVRELLAHRQSVLASINDSFAMVDRDWKFIYLNRKAADMYGMPKEDLLGRIFWEAVPDLSASYRRQIEEAAQKQQELQTEYFHSVSQRWFEERIYPSSTGVSIFASDITERKQAEENLRYQLGITQAITDNAADSLFLLDPAGRVTFMNPAAEKTFGWKKEELLGKVLHDHVHYHRNRAAKLECPLHSVFTSGLTLRDLEDQFHCKDGSRLYVSCSNAAIVIDGEATGSVLVVHDITYHKLAEQQLKALNENLEMRVAERAAIAEQRATQLSALASELTQTEQRERRRLAHILHDNLQQILVATKLQVSMMRGRVEDEGLREDMLQIEELINRSVEESRTLTVELSPPILYDAGLGRALEWLARQMQEKHGLTVKLEADPSAEPEGDDIRAFLFQAVREALFNIVKHAGVEEATVSISPAAQGGVVVQVTDKGLGFDLQPSENQDFSSGGFGLFSIRERLEFLGGRVVVTSSPGRGTCVSLYIPLREEKESPVNEGNNNQSESDRSGNDPTSVENAENVIRVLLADDHKMLRDGLAGLLREQRDIQVISEASDGHMAVKLAHETDPHVVIMDVTMPRMNGVDATRRITAELPHIKVIGLSMHEKEDMANAMREAGAVSYITKGARSEILTAAIRDCMRADNESPSTPHDPSALGPSARTP